MVEHFGGVTTARNQWNVLFISEADLNRQNAAVKVSCRDLDALRVCCKSRMRTASVPASISLCLLIGLNECVIYNSVTN